MGVVFGDYTPRERIKKDFSDPNIIDIEWLDENKNPIGIKTINGIDFSDIVYGQKARVRVRFKDFSDGRGVFISIDSNNSKCRFKPEIRMMSVKNNEIVTEPFILPISMYFDEIEEYNYENHCTKVNKPQELYVTVLVTTTLNKEQKHILKPYTYFRNYEELIGLFEENGNGKKNNTYKLDLNDPKKSTQNYEDKFIHDNGSISKIVTDFIKFIDTLSFDITTNKADITNEVRKQAKALWKASITQVQGGKLDDRQLYWARNKMQTYLKRHPFFKTDIDFEKSEAKGPSLKEIIQLFEEKSRNYNGIDFSKAGGKKKVLITGFDPFILNQFDNPDFIGNVLQSNPSGCVALSLNDINIGNCYIQTMIVPVRYSDFDGNQDNAKGQGEGIIEKYIKPWINQVDMIITVSQYRPKENVIDMFGTSRRGGFNDNENFIRESGSQAVSTKFEWIQTTLPKTFANAPFVKFNWKFDGVLHPENTIPKSEQILSEGSGGDYLSNEIFYRVGKMRNEIRPTLATGHFHIEKLQESKQDLKDSEIKRLLNIVKNGIEEGIKGI